MSWERDRPHPLCSAELMFSFQPASTFAAEYRDEILERFLERLGKAHPRKRAVPETDAMNDLFSLRGKRRRRRGEQGVSDVRFRFSSRGQAPRFSPTIFET